MFQYDIVSVIFRVSLYHIGTDIVSVILRVFLYYIGTDIVSVILRVFLYYKYIGTDIVQFSQCWLSTYCGITKELFFCKTSIHKPLPLSHEISGDKIKIIYSKS